MKSAFTGIVSLVAVLLFTFTLGFIWTGNAKVDFQRVAMIGDRSTAEVIHAYEKSLEPEAVEVVDTGMTRQPSGPVQGGGDNTVVWINIPGFRGDYVEQAPAAFLNQLSNEGAATTKMRPNFPTVTYPGHITMATGTTPDRHGIPSDRFRVNGTIVDKPMDPSLLLAEPIWETATRQGMVTLVHDWPLSQNQTGENKAAYFLNDFNPDESDQVRLDRLWETWSTHQGDQKLRLLMCRLDDTLKAGMINGPRTPETYDAVKKVDELLSGFIKKAKAAWPNLRGSQNANLVFLITTDHGLAGLEKNVNLPMLLGDDLMNNLDVATHDAIGHLYFKNLPESEAEAKLRKDQIDAELKKRIYFRTYTPEDLPSDWKYTSSDGRIGDRVLVLKSGFAFSDFEADEPVFDPGVGPGFFGGFGYPVSSSIRMSGQVILWAYPDQVAEGDLGEFDQTVFHATVAELLKIEKSDKAADNALPVK